MESEIRIIALRETDKGYRFAELSIKKDGEGNYRKWAEEPSYKVYKTWNNAKKACIKFFGSLRSLRKNIYYGTISNEDYRGQIACKTEIDYFLNH
jgi:hypothetical protein